MPVPPFALYGLGAARTVLAAVIGSMTRRPWAWIGAVFLILIAFPAIDITVSSWFFDATRRTFIARAWGPSEWIRRTMPYFIFGGGIYVLVLWICGEFFRQVYFGVTRRVAIYLTLSLALGPGLIVNVLFKDHWGRPRPSTITEFGGIHPYVAPFIPGGGCDYNCSFPSGHAALAFWLVSFAFLLPPPWRKWGIASSFLFGILVGLSRIAQGGHFVSDVAASAVITVSLAFWLYRRIVAPPSRTTSKNNPHFARESS